MRLCMVGSVGLLYVGMMLEKKDCRVLRLYNKQWIKFKWLKSGSKQSRQKSYVDLRKRKLEFQVGDHVFLKISPTKGVIRFGFWGKLSPRFVVPFEVLERMGKVAYRLALSPSLSGVHNVFHVSMLRKYIPNPSHVVDYKPLKLRDDLTYEEQPIKIVDKKEQELKRRTIHYVKVQWRN